MFLAALAAPASDVEKFQLFVHAAGSLYRVCRCVRVSVRVRVRVRVRVCVFVCMCCVWLAHVSAECCRARGPRRIL